MNTQNSSDSSRRGASTANPPASTPDHYPIQDHSFTLQMIMELQRSVGQISESMNQTNRNLERLDSSIECRLDRTDEKSERRFDSLESSMSGVKTTIAVAGIILAIILTVGSFVINKAWDSLVDHIDISMKK
jgi:hypothetical protein